MGEGETGDREQLRAGEREDQHRLHRGAGARASGWQEQLKMAVNSERGEH